MDTAADDRLAFTPPPQPGMLRAMVLAVLAHLLLVAALTVGLRWQTEAQNVVAEAELWSAVPREAAPPEVVTPPPPPPAPAPVVQPPVVRAPPLPDPQVQRDAEIAVERDRQKREAEKEKRELAEKRELQRREAEKREAAERRKEELAERRKEEFDRKRKLEAAERKREQELEKKQEQAKAVAEARRKEEDRKRKQQELEARDSKRLAQLREENMRRMQGMAGSGSPGATGNSAQSSGPSASWGSKVQARVRPHIVFSDDAPGNPKAEVEVRMAPDGTIVGKRLVKSSGVKAWDEAVLRALDKAESLPRDSDGRVHSPVVIEFRPRG